MESLPSSIEAYLQEAGFSGTEIIVLKKLLEEDALTLRELASKTGKSTGVLDQAVKKLLKKDIITRESINDTPKYTLKSLNSILDWMNDDMRSKQQMIVRRHENFESFIRSLTVGKKRPEMEYFEGLEGIKRAYMELLNRGNDIVQYGPTLYLAEEDPLRNFRVQYFRDRRNRGIFSRVITHNTVLGRRFHSRDSFEYRKTILVDPEAYPFNFEKIIIGDTVACFQLEDERACFIKYPELAQDERNFFERMWNKKIVNENAPPPEKELPPVITIGAPLKTRTLSQMREFFLSRKSVAALFLCSGLAALITYGLYQHNVALATKRIQDKVVSIAATGVLQFNAADLEEIHTLKDAQKPQYQKLVYQLNQIRNQNEGVKYVYLMRQIKGNIWEFVADADTLEPYKKIDLNKDGQFTDYDEPSYPGLRYDTSDSVPSVEESLNRPTSFEPEIDQWGSVIAGWAPIKDNNGKTIAILGVDIEAEMVQQLSERSLLPLIYFVGFLVLFLLIRLSAFNRSLFKEIGILLSKKKVLLIAISSLTMALLISYLLYLKNIQENIKREGGKILSIAVTGSLQFSAEELNQLKSLEDTKLPLYQSVVKRLINIRSQNENIKYVYILRPRKNSTVFSFIADADSASPYNDVDINMDGIINDSDEPSYSGLPFDIEHISVLREGNYFNPIINEELYTDQWGTVLSAYAPIKDNRGAVIGLLGIDIDADYIYAFQPIILSPMLLYAVVVIIYIFLNGTRYKKLLVDKFI